MIVQRCVRYPVKSLRGEVLPALDIDERGVVGDRWWALYTEAGKFGSGKSSRRFAYLPRLLEMASSLEGDGPVIALPDGRRVSGDGVDAAVSTVVGEPVTVAPEGAVSHLDAAPVHVLTGASLRWWSAQVPGVPVGWARARPNLLVDGEGEGRVEDGWTGRLLHVGSVVLEVLEPTIRCVVVGQAQEDLPADGRLLRSLDEHDLALGCYARVVVGNLVAVGDTLTVE